MKVCIKCREEKELEDFSRKKTAKDGRNARCKECTREYTRRHYKENKQYYLDKAKIYNEKYKERFDELMIELKSKPCLDCETEYHPCQMDFDHRPGEDKKYDICKMQYYSIEEVLKEIEKCDLVCSNCHRLRTYLRGPQKRYALIYPLATNQ